MRRSEETIERDNGAGEQQKEVIGMRSRLNLFRE
jgi:hypothetical protein